MKTTNNDQKTPVERALGFILHIGDGPVKFRTAIGPEQAIDAEAEERARVVHMPSLASGMGIASVCQMTGGRRGARLEY